MSCLSPNLIPLLISRFLFGAFNGITAPMASVLLTEITPVHNRGRYFVFTGNTFAIGALIAVAISAALFDSP
jgi:MFS family permease